MENNKLRRGRPPGQLVYQRLEDAIADLWERMGGLQSPTEAEGIWTSIWYQEAHHSTALEGNTLVIAQVEELLAEGRARRKGWRPSDRRGVSPPTPTPPEEKPGSFRRYDIEPFPGGMVPPSWVEVPAVMVDWLNSLATITTLDNPIEAIAVAHAGSERTHPFLDGNGRTGRLLLNLLLVRLGYPPAVIYTRDRNRYLRALRRADDGDPGPLGELIGRAVTDNLYRFVVPAIAGPHRLVPLVSLATKTQSVFTLRAAIERGRLRAQKGPDGQWRSSRAWVHEYVANKYKRDS